MKKISIVIPVYYNEHNLKPLYQDMKNNVLGKIYTYGYDYEIVFVDDGSKDGSYDEMKALKQIDNKIVNLHLSKNFGSHAAILAGLSICTGDCAVIKAADLQEPSEMIIDMLEQYNKGYRVVLAVREDREEGFFQKCFANVYYELMRKFALKEMPKGGFDCFLIDRRVINALSSMEEKNTSLMGLLLWSGFKTTQVGYVRKKRDIGKSKWTLKKKIKLVSDSMFSFSTFPIQMISTIGIVVFFAAFLCAIYIVASKIRGTIIVSGYTTLSVIMLAGFGLTLFSLGILGEYIWRIFDAVRKRPPFIIEEDSNEKND